MRSIVDYGNGLEVDLGVTQKCAEDALRIIEKGLPQRLQCRTVYDQVMNDMKRILDTVPVSISKNSSRGVEKC